MSSSVSPLPDPFARQRLLPEVGDAGQARLQQGTAYVPAGPGAVYAADYLHRAGVGSVHRVGEMHGAAFPHRRSFRYEPSGELALGAWQALRSIRSLLTDALSESK